MSLGVALIVFAVFLFLSLGFMTAIGIAKQQDDKRNLKLSWYGGLCLIVTIIALVRSLELLYFTANH